MSGPQQQRLLAYATSTNLHHQSLRTIKDQLLIFGIESSVTSIPGIVNTASVRADGRFYYGERRSPRHALICAIRKAAGLIP